MFHIKVNGIRQSYEEIESQIAKHSSIIIQVKDVLRNLSTVTGMEDMITALSKQVEILEIEKKQYIQMLQSLDLIMAYYDECEKRNIRRCELGDNWSFKVSFTKNDFAGIADELNNII